VELALILRINGTGFTYTLDDPYIHLALAENLARGHYGVNEQEFSAPSSSALWPFLLVPFARTSFDHYVPLVLDLAAALATVFLFARIVTAAFPESETRAARSLPAALVILLFLGTNVVGLAFTGMEHSLQLLFVVWILHGLVRELETAELPRWLPIALAGAPLVRYENLALSLPALVFLGTRGHARAALLCGGAIAAGLGGFALALGAMGLGALPSSVVAKSNPVASGGALRAVAGNVSVGLATRQGAILGLGWILLALAVVRRRAGAERGFAAVAASCVSLHFAMGRFGWYNRYEAYAFGALLVSLVFLHRGTLLRLAGRGGGAPAVGVAGALIAVGAFPYLHGLYTLPVAANNIHQQHFQMHRFVTEYYRAPVAVNDLGWVSYRNDAYVLDVWGLASREALRRRQAGGDPAWMGELAAEHGVKLAMLYASWFPDLPENWKVIGTLSFRRKLVSAAQSKVTFYALDAETHARASRLLIDFRETLPAGVDFRFAGEEGPD
jgi:hypothetical protein